VPKGVEFMNRRILSIFLAAGLVASVMAAGGPVRAQDAPEVPAEPNIVDPRGDANGHSSLTGQGGGVTIGAADYMAVWFTNDADNLYVHFQTVFPGFSAGSIWYSIFVDPGVGDDCMEFRAFTEHEAVSPRGQLRLTGDCGDAVEDAEFVTVEGPEDEGSATGLHTITVPRSLTEHLADGKTIAGPNALSRYFAGTDDTGGVGLGIIDATDVGTEYTITDEKAKKKDTKKKVKGKKGAKGKRTKKGKKGGKKKKAAQCKTFQAGELGAEADTIKVTDKATEKKPVEQTVTLDASLADFVVVQEPSRAYFNVQVDSKKPKVGLYALFEFPTRRDYDVELLHPDGSYAARSHDFNPLQETPAGDLGANEGHGGESTASTEKLVGIATRDCGGWTVEAVNWLGEGGEFPIKVWLGPVEHEPQPEGEEPRE
jgi:hypothetical protein